MCFDLHNIIVLVLPKLLCCGFTLPTMFDLYILLLLCYGLTFIAIIDLVLNADLYAVLWSYPKWCAMVLPLLLCYGPILNAVLWSYPKHCAMAALWSYPYCCTMALPFLLCMILPWLHWNALIINAVLDFTLIVVICTDRFSCNVLALCWGLTHTVVLGFAFNAVLWPYPYCCAMAVFWFGAKALPILLFFILPLLLSLFLPVSLYLILPLSLSYGLTLIATLLCWHCGLWHSMLSSPGSQSSASQSKTSKI